jgi:antitoxin (DNA-binding transcriptional repressor) of toxin-antitoxin stability system
MVTLTVSQARASLPELLTRVEDGEEVTITRHGRPVAVLVRPDIMRSRAKVIIEDAGRIHELIAAPSVSEPPGHGGLTAERADQLVSAIRSGRESR